MSQENVVEFLRAIGDRPHLLNALKMRPKDRVVKAAADLGYPFTMAEFDQLIWDLEGKLAEARNEAFDQHFSLWQTMWGRYYLEVLAVDLMPSLLETRIR
ncbi:MAG TPA: Nif11-like leader peptide family natural product precursor [Mycobacteriales bacterium]|nr:Nif11-like leader peptide family natural product precursor [Mycobacteriales bacterium]